MGTPGASAGPLFLPSASAPPRKRAAGEAGVARSKQRVLDEEEYIEVLAQCERWRLSGPSPDSRSSPQSFFWSWNSQPPVEQLPLGLESLETQGNSAGAGVQFSTKSWSCLLRVKEIKFPVKVWVDFDTFLG